MKRIPKKYGEYKTDWCPYCGKKALHKNPLKLNVCKEHKDCSNDPSLKTSTGEWLEVRCSKFGNYCYSVTRGNISLKDAFTKSKRSLEE